MMYVLKEATTPRHNALLACATESRLFRKVQESQKDALERYAQITTISGLNLGSAIIHVTGSAFELEDLCC